MPGFSCGLVIVSKRVCEKESTSEKFSLFWGFSNMFYK